MTNEDKRFEVLAQLLRYLRAKKQGAFLHSVQGLLNDNIKMHQKLKELGHVKEAGSSEEGSERSSSDDVGELGIDPVVHTERHSDPKDLTPAVHVGEGQREEG